MTASETLDPQTSERLALVISKLHTSAAEVSSQISRLQTVGADVEYRRAKGEDVSGESIDRQIAELNSRAASISSALDRANADHGAARDREFKAQCADVRCSLEKQRDQRAVVRRDAVLALRTFVAAMDTLCESEKAYRLASRAATAPWPQNLNDYNPDVAAIHKLLTPDDVDSSVLERELVDFAESAHHHQPSVFVMVHEEAMDIR